MGSITRVKVYYCDLEKILENSSVKIYGTSLKGESLKNINKIKKGIILFGSESNGIRKSLNKYIDDWISIDKLGNAESLNVSVSAGIIVNHLK